jgi:prevent-host-death family protein
LGQVGAPGEELDIHNRHGLGQSQPLPNGTPQQEAANVVAYLAPSVSEVVASQVSVRDLKTHLSEWLARAQSGEVVEVTSHRKPIARIMALNTAASASTNPLQKAIDAGVISWNGKNPVIPPPVKLNDGGPLMSDIVIEDRG